MPLRSALLALVTLPLLAACPSPPECKPSAVKLPAAGDTLNWVGDGYAMVNARSGDFQGAFILDTGFSQSALGTEFAKVVDPFSLELDLGATHVGPLVAGLLQTDAVDGVLGAETLHQLPLIFDPLARTTDILAAFEAPLEGAAPMTIIAPTTCRLEEEANGPGGPFAFLVRAEVEGVPLTFLLDTGASASFVRSEVATRLTDRATLTNLRIGSGFAGDFEATATRAKTITVGNGESPNQVILFASEIDAELDRLSGLYDAAKSTDFEGEVRVDGFLGWTFLREFKVSLAEGASATTGRTLSLQRYDTQAHWQREFIGIGLYRSEPAATEPAGIKIDGFMGTSPARDAGLKEGDIIEAVDGVEVTAESPIYFNGKTAKFTYRRNTGDAQAAVWSTNTATVAYADLLPNPPP